MKRDRSFWTGLVVGFFLGLGTGAVIAAKCPPEPVPATRPAAETGEVAQ
jgi:hypothetical protein